jgi:hypothetical protein
MHKCGNLVHAPTKRTTFLCWTSLYQEKWTNSGTNVKLLNNKMLRIMAKWSNQNINSSNGIVERKSMLN